MYVADIGKDAKARKRERRHEEKRLLMVRMRITAHIRATGCCVVRMLQMAAQGRRDPPRPRQNHRAQPGDGIKRHVPAQFRGQITAPTARRQSRQPKTTTSPCPWPRRGVPSGMTSPTIARITAPATPPNAPAMKSRRHQQWISRRQRAKQSPHRKAEVEPQQRLLAIKSIQEKSRRNTGKAPR